MPQYNPDFILPTLARKPDTAHPYDEEFDEGTTLDAAWNARIYDSDTTTFSEVTMSSDVCSTYNGSSEFRVNVNPTQRPSYLRAQPPEGKSGWLWRAVTVPENFLIYMRFNTTSDLAVNSSERGSVGIVLTEANTGDSSLPGDINNHISMTMLQYPGHHYHMVPLAQKRHNGTAYNTKLYDRHSEGSPIEYLAMHKIGTTYHCYAGSESNWVKLNTFAGVSFNMTHLKIAMIDKPQTSSDPNRIQSIDFIRFLETDKFPIF